MIGRRRFIAIAAGAGLGTAIASRVLGATATLPFTRWRGIALGASASITIAHPDAPRLLTLAHAEITRLEAIFSLYRGNSVLARLNRNGRIEAPPMELVELLSQCGSLHAQTNGAFDPTIQPLWALYARHHAAGTAPDAVAIAQSLDRTGWQHVAFAPDAVTLQAEGAALSLNGIAQGYIADKVADLLIAEGMSDVMVDMGEIAAVGRAPDGAPWRVGIADPADPTRAASYRRLSNSALATSAPLGTTFDQAGTVGHILDPRTGMPGGRWRQVSVIARTAARADGLSTAFCLMERDEIRRASTDIEVHLIR